MKGRLAMSGYKPSFFRLRQVDLREQVGKFSLDTKIPSKGKARLETRGTEGKLTIGLKNLRSFTEEEKSNIHYHLWLTGNGSQGKISVYCGEIAIGAGGEGEYTWSFDPLNMDGFAIGDFEEIVISATLGELKPELNSSIPLKGLLAFKSLPPASVTPVLHSSTQSPLPKERGETLSTWDFIDGEDQFDLMSLRFCRELEYTHLSDDVCFVDEEPASNEKTQVRSIPYQELPEEDAFYEIRWLFKK